MKINRSNRLLLGLLITAAAVPSLAFALGTGGPGGDTVTPTSQPQITVASGATVNGPLLVQPAATVTPGVPIVTPGPGTSSAIGGVVAGTGGPVVVTQTLLDTTQNSQVTTGSGGASIQTNGDTVLSASSTVTDTVNYGRAVTFEVAQAGNSNPVGLPILPTATYYLTSPTGTPVPGAPTFATEALLDAYIATLTPATMLALDPTLGTSVAAVGAGGNLTVNGQTTTNGIDNTGNQINNLAAGTLATDAANVGQVTAGDAAVTTAFQAADNVVRNEFAAADTALSNRINAEATTRANEDTSIRNEFRAADTAINNRVDSLASDVKSNRYQIDRNTRGIAMVAAMTNSTVLPGKTQVLDFNLAQFDDATGFAFGYGYRVNENLQINAAGASTTDFDEAVARLGISYQW